MLKHDYLVKTNHFINKKKNLKKVIIFLDTYTPKLVTWIFYCTLVYLMFKRDVRVLYVATIPWLTFLLVTLIRNRFNLKRPFEELNLNPLVSHSPGRACPSKHASSSIIIAIALYYIFPLLGLSAIFLSVVICFTRVLTGVHYPRDILWGITIGTVMGYMGFFILL